MILALDTTGIHGSLALMHATAAVDEISMQAQDGFAQVLYGYLDEILHRNRATLADVECFAAACGPGSFTGVRVGLACIKGLAEVTGKPAFGVSNLQAVASFGTASLRAALIDARRGDVYAAVYDSAGSLVRPETVTKLEPWLESLPIGDIEILSADVDCDKAVRTPRAVAAAVARIAAMRLACGEAGDPAALDANYVRRSDAEMFWKDIR